jgi:predicted permease
MGAAYAGVTQDLRYALRMLRRAPGFTAVAVLSLALGIGANTAIFTLIESSLLRPIRVKHPDRLRLLTWLGKEGGWVAPNLGYASPTFGAIYEQRVPPEAGYLHDEFSPPVYQALRRDNTVFDPLFGFKELGRVTAVVGGGGNAEAVNCFLVSGDFYRGMEVSPIIGRAIGPDDDVPGAQGQVAMISYEYWTRRFARSASVIGQTIALNEVPVTIVGVNAEYFTGIEPGANFEIWAPLNLSPGVSGHSFLDEEKIWSIPILGRLKPGISDARAQSEMEALFQAQVEAHPGGLAGMLQDPAKRPRFILDSADRGVDYLGARYTRPLLALLALAGLVLLIGCANVANLLLAKAAVRQREISLRLAMGAGRWRVTRQLLTEGLLLASMAGVAGVILGYWTRNGVPALLQTPWRPSPFDTAFDPKVLLASVGLTFLTGVLFSLAPVWQSRRVEINEALKDSSRGTASLSKLRIGRLLVVLQVALSVLLLAGAGLCVKTFTNLRNTPLGFRPDGVLLFTLDPPRLRYPAERIGALLTQLQEHLGTIPGVQSVTFSGSRAGTTFSIDNHPFAQTFDNYAGALDVGSGFFQTMGIPILQGRGILEHDDERDTLNGPNAPLLNAVVVNQEFARHTFPNENAVGKTFKGADNLTYRIVGVSGDWRFEHLREPIHATFYNALIQAPRQGRVNFELRIAGNEAGIARQLRQAVRSLDSDLAITDLRTGTQLIEDDLSQERLLASLAAVFGGLALILATIGIYGVMAHAVARRTNEIGIRVALGARPGGVAWMVLRETLVLAAAGVAMGIPAVLALSPLLDRVLAPAWIDNFMYGAKPNDPATIAAAGLVLAAAGFTAGYFPARRAARVDPMTALRHE